MRMTDARSADALMINLDEGKERVNGAELPGGVGFIGLAADGSVVAIELLDASRHYPMSALAALGEDETVMSLADAAAIAGLTPLAMRKAVERGRLAAQKLGRDWVVTASSLTAYLNNRRSREPATAS
jgi:uncharacterized protein YuzE